MPRKAKEKSINEELPIETIESVKPSKVKATKKTSKKLDSDVLLETESIMLSKKTKTTRKKVEDSSTLDKKKTTKKSTKVEDAKKAKTAKKEAVSKTTKKTTTKAKTATAKTTKAKLADKEPTKAKVSKKVEEDKKTATSKKATKSSSTTAKATSSKSKATSKVKDSEPLKAPKSKSTTAKKTTKKASTAKTKTVAKKTAKKNIDNTPISIEYYDLPYKYNKTVVKLLAQNPNTLFAYWEVSDDDIQKFKDTYGENFLYITKPVLVIHNLTDNYSYEIDVNDFANNWYIPVTNTMCKYTVELIRKPTEYTEQIRDNLHITASNVIESPNDHVLFFKDNDRIYFKNIHTNKYTERVVKPFLKNVWGIYNNLNITSDINSFDFNNPSSQNPTSHF